MRFHVTGRWGDDEAEPSRERLLEALAELDVEDPEHPDTSLTHESQWCLEAFQSGLLVWENLESGQPRHMRHVPRERVLALWLKLADGRIEEIDGEPWLPGYGGIAPSTE